MIFIVTEFTCTEFGSVLCVQVVTDLKDRHTATATQLPTAATGDHSRTLSELHHNDAWERAPVIMYLIVFSGTPLTVKHLVKACKSVTDWHTLGLQLDLTTTQLNSIHVTYYALGVDRLKTEMFDVWLKSSPDASWMDVITALEDMGMDRVASNVRAAYSPTAPGNV